MIGSELKHYKILRLLGKGGMGEVYLATDTTLDRQVALKTLPVDLARSPERRARFEREAKAVAALNHPNIVTIYSVEEHPSAPSTGSGQASSGQAGPVSFITMELVEGKSLRELIPSDGLSLSLVFNIAIPLADALAVAHRKGVTHRDVKPSNVMLDAEGRVKVLDFGLAKLLAPADVTGTDAETATMPISGPRTEEGKIVGTAAYMSPEQAEGKPVDARTDIFSLGVVLYEMATGRRPFQGDTSISTISSILKDTPPRVSDLKPGLPRDLGRIIERCLEKNPRKRFQTARDVANELEGLKQEIDSGELHGVSKPPRNKKPIAAALVVGAVLLAGAASMLWPRLQSKLSGGTVTAMDDKSIAVLPFANVSDDKENEYFSDGLAEELLNRLSRVPDLRVAARTSSFHFKGHTGDVSEVAQQLNVTTVLEGSVRRAGDEIRVTAQLIKASDGFPLWSESYDGQLGDVFGIQEKIATKVVEALKITLLGEDARRLASRPTDNVEAYEAYLLGHQRMRLRRADELEQAVEYFQRAIDLDPEFALAYVGQAEAVDHLVAYGTLPLIESFERSMALLDRAMELDDQLGEAYAVRGSVRQQRSIFADSPVDIDDAIADYERAIELSPSYAMAYMWYGRVFQYSDPEGALSLFRQALELDPLSVLIHSNIAEVLERLGRTEEALQGYRRALEIDPGFTVGYVSIGQLYENRGRFAEAIRWNLEAHRREPSSRNPLVNLAGLYSLLGDQASGRLWLNRLGEIDGGAFWVEYIQSLVLYPQQGEWAKVEVFCREGAAVVPEQGRMLLFDFDLEAGNYDAILEHEVEFAPGLFEDPPEINYGNIDGALRAGAALAGRGDHSRAQQLLKKSEEFLLGLDEAFRRASFPDLLAGVYLFQGRYDDALTEWRIAFENGWRPTLNNQNREWWFMGAPFKKFDPVRDDPRFRALQDDIRTEFDRQRRALEREGLAIKE